MVEHAALYLLVIIGGEVAGIGFCLLWRGRHSPWLAIALIVLGSGWTAGVVRGIERAHRPVIVVRVVLDKPSG